MRRLGFTFAVVLVVAPASFAGSAPGQAVEPTAPRGLTATPPLAGTWRRLPGAPIAAHWAVSAWTGRQMLIFGRAQPTPPWSVDAAAAYDPATDTWRRLAPFPGPTGNYEGRYWAIWTGKEMVVFGPFDFQAFNPLTNHWRRLPNNAAPPGGIVVWTGRELIGWGGGCCSDASSEGAAYNPVTNTRRKLARSPLAPEQWPIGAWTGRELVLFVSGIRPTTTKPWPARLARAAAYNPVTDTWRRIAPLPARRTNANAVWDGREVLIVGGTGAPRGGNPPAPAAVGFAYNPVTNRWRRLAPMKSGRSGAAAVWTGKRLLIWGGTTSSLAGFKLVTPSQGLAYDPNANRWSPLPWAPLLGRLDPTAVWTGHAMIVWGGQRPATPVGTGDRFFADGAAFRPASP
ncbi:MAG: hypothetical protein ACXVE0_12975 [Gaiellaceae bacterium]